MSEEMVTVSKAYLESLIEDQNWLFALEDAGVSEWDKYEYALRIYKEEYCESR